jgi:HSP20 family protein
MTENGTCATLEKAPESTVTKCAANNCGCSFVPAVDIVELADEIVVHADVPGATPEGIDINYENGLLSLHARVETRQAPEKGRHLLREYGVGDYHRQFRIGEGVDTSKIEAKVANGVLTLHLPKSEEVKPRKISVKVV